MSEQISEEEGQALLRMARESIGEKLGCNPAGGPKSPGIKKALLKQKTGLFVTLHKKGQLRGCIGNIEPVRTLEEGVRENARHAAFRDRRFAPLSPEEFDGIDIEISLLSRPEKLEFESGNDLIACLKPGRDGVIVEKGGMRATFLPQVWAQLPMPESFLNHLCSKAGLPADSWQKPGLAVWTYQVQSFEETP